MERFVFASSYFLRVHFSNVQLDSPDAVTLAPPWGMEVSFSGPPLLVCSLPQPLLAQTAPLAMWPWKCEGAWHFPPSGHCPGFSREQEPVVAVLSPGCECDVSVGI